jgi:hypothetical protein
MTHLRMVFTVYWQTANPSTEMIYLAAPPAESLPLRIIAAAEAEVLAMVTAHAEPGAVPLQAIYIADRAVDMSPEEVTAADWRVMPQSQFIRHTPHARQAETEET